MMTSKIRGVCHTQLYDPPRGLEGHLRDVQYNDIEALGCLPYPVV
jgi:hypothetical protein